MKDEGYFSKLILGSIFRDMKQITMNEFQLANRYYYFLKSGTRENKLGDKNSETLFPCRFLAKQDRKKRENRERKRKLHARKKDENFSRESTSLWFRGLRTEFFGETFLPAKKKTFSLPLRYFFPLRSFPDTFIYIEAVGINLGFIAWTALNLERRLRRTQEERDDIQCQDRDWITLARRIGSRPLEIKKGKKRPKTNFRNAIRFHRFCHALSWWIFKHFQYLVPDSTLHESHFDSNFKVNHYAHWG